LRLTRTARNDPAFERNRKTMKVSSRACAVLLLRLAAWAAAVLILPAAARAESGAANFTTNSFVVLLPRARGVIPGAYGTVQAKLSSRLMLSLQFNLVAGPGFAEGPVTATTDDEGRVVKLAKGNEKCAIFYNQTGAASRVHCRTKTNNRALKGGVDEIDDEDSGSSGGFEAVEVGSHVSRRLSDCSSCLAEVRDTFSAKLRAVCGEAFGRLAASSTYPWAKVAAAALCAMRIKLGSPRNVAYQTCRCSCDINADCPAFYCDSGGEPCIGVCSSGVCRADPLGPGKACPDADDNDCQNRHCARATYPSGPYVCCPTGRYVPSRASAPRTLTTNTST
jgi:hypothetical protein